MADLKKFVWVSSGDTNYYTSRYGVILAQELSALAAISIILSEVID